MLVLELWLETAVPTFKVGHSQTAIDKKLMAIAPPMDVRQAPRPNKDNRYWKVKEFKHSLLFYCLPVLGGILDRQYLQHQACPVEALHGSTGPLGLPQQCSRPVLTWVHGLKHASAVPHFGKRASHWSPTWAHSAFPFEAGDGTPKEAVKASSSISH